MKKISKKEKPIDEVLLNTIQQHLSVGEFIPYNKLVEKIGLDKKVGKSKQLQLEDLKRFIDYEYDKNSKKYLITNIYKECSDKPLKKLRKDAIYTKYIEVLLLSYLKDNSGINVIKSKKMWWLILSMININYIKYNKSKARELIVKDLGNEVDIDNVNEFYDRVNKRFTTLFYRALDSLTHRKLIEYRTTYIIRYETDDVLREATKDEISEILDCEREALNMVGLKSDIQLYLYPEKLYKYYSVLSELEYNKYGIVEAYREIEILHGTRFLDMELNYTKQELKKLTLESNEKFKLNIDNEAINKFNKNRITLPDKEIDTDSDMEVVLYTMEIEDDSLFIANDRELKHYLKSQKLLSDKLLKISEDNE